MLLKLAKKLLPRGAAYRKILLGPAAGVKVRIDFAHQSRLYFGLYEYELAPYFRELIYPGAKCFDVGGADGYDALMQAKLSGDAGVVTFECEQRFADELQRTLDQNAYKVQVVRAYAGDVDSGDNITLDAAAQKYFMPDFIKLDIEGAEMRALRGAARILEQRKPNLLVETHAAHLETECIALLRGYGYEPKIVDQRRWFKERRPTAHNRWLICPGRRP